MQNYIFAIYPRSCILMSMSLSKIYSTIVGRVEYLGYARRSILSRFSDYTVYSYSGRNDFLWNL